MMMVVVEVVMEVVVVMMEWGSPEVGAWRPDVSKVLYRVHKVRWLIWIGQRYCEDMYAYTSLGGPTVPGAWCLFTSTSAPYWIRTSIPSPGAVMNNGRCSTIELRAYCVTDA